MTPTEFGDTTLTKVFVGGLAWETPVHHLRDYFHTFGDILEAVVITDKLSGRSKGYGFVTFKEPEAAKKACEDPAPIINGRRANCNLAVHGSRRTKTSPTPPPRQPGMIAQNAGGKPRLVLPAPALPPGNAQWYFPTGVPVASPFYHHNPRPVYLYGSSPAYIAADYNQLNQKVSWNGGTQYPQQIYRGATVHGMRGPATNTWMTPMYQQQQVYYQPHGPHHLPTINGQFGPHVPYRPSY